MWLQDPRCANIVQEAWHKGLYKPDGAAITNCHATCHDQLTAWNKLEFGHVVNKIAKLNQKLQVLKNHPICNDTEIHEVRATLNRWLDAEIQCGTNAREICGSLMVTRILPSSIKKHQTEKIGTPFRASMMQRGNGRMIFTLLRTSFWIILRPSFAPIGLLIPQSWLMLSNL